MYVEWSTRLNGENIMGTMTITICGKRWIYYDDDNPCGLTMDEISDDTIGGITETEITQCENMFLYESICMYDLGGCATIMRVQ